MNLRMQLLNLLLKNQPINTTLFLFMVELDLEKLTSYKPLATPFKTKVEMLYTVQ